MSDKAVRLRQQVDEAINDITRRLFGRVAPKTLRLTTFAILDVPFAAVHRHVANGTTPPGYVDGLIDQAYSALVRRRTPHASGDRRRNDTRGSPQTTRKIDMQTMETPDRRTENAVERNLEAARRLFRAVEIGIAPVSWRPTTRTW